jgi:hypothetical protein
MISMNPPLQIGDWVVRAGLLILWLIVNDIYDSLRGAAIPAPTDW